MTIEAARSYILSHPEAQYKEGKGHARYVEALAVIEQQKQDELDAMHKTPRVLDNPRFGRMRR